VAATAINGSPLFGLQRPAHRDDSRLVVVSNRAPVRVVTQEGAQRLEPTVGGVGATFMRLLERQGGLWLAWSGSKGPVKPLMLPADNPRFAMVFPPLTEHEIAQYYYGTCNCLLWPLMHFMTQHCRFDSTHWNCYRNVNASFAAFAASQCNPSDRVWIQDFHLALVPDMLRRRRPTLPIGLFWHVPFPPPSVFGILPWRQEFIEGMLGADVIGFHTAAYADHFLQCCDELCGLAVNRERRLVSFKGREIKVDAFPLGVPAEYFAQLGQSLRVQARARKIRASLNVPYLILGVDRLDYTKGLLERLAGFERFLEVSPEFRGRATLLQIAVPSRSAMPEYAQLKRQFDEAVGKILGRFSTAGWSPVRYLYDQLDTEELAAYYQAADVALITPLRDGMNLVAKEYVASRGAHDGALVLSEFAGAAQELREALLVNPYDADALAANLRHALTMDSNERSARMRALRERVFANDLDTWAQRFLGAMQRHSCSRYAAAAD
jgi:alpha,alpha-trehalose-phosphate synthase [UDP-forming]